MAATLRFHLRYDLFQIGENDNMATQLLNYARNAGKPTPVASAIMTKRVNAPRLLASVRLLKHATSHQKMRKTEALSLARHPHPERSKQ
jgi:hypothetical protein